MNSLVIPPPPNWYETSILACAPDNTLIYGSRNDIVVIQDTPNNQPANIRTIPRAHSQKITCTSINRNWGQPNKLLVTVAEDKIIKLWNIDLMEKKLAHNDHAQHGKVIGATFAGDEKVISVSEEGVIIVWNISLNQTNTIKDIFGFKVTVTCISTCPHATWLTAFGLKTGLVVITDLRKDGKVLYKLRGHDKSVLSLAWCPAPVNIFPKDPNNHVGTKERKNRKPKQSENANDASKSETTNSESVVSKSKSEVGPKNDVWLNIKHADDDDSTQGAAEQLPKLHANDDFLKECQTLKNRILGAGPSDADITGVCALDRPVLKAKKGHDKNRKTPGERMDMTKESEENIANSEISAEKVIPLCESKEEHANVEGTKTVPNDSVDTEVKEIALAETKSEKPSSENKTETCFGRTQQEVPFLTPSPSTDNESVEIQDKSMSEVSCIDEEAPDGNHAETPPTKSKTEILLTDSEEISPFKSSKNESVEEVPSTAMASKEKGPDGDKKRSIGVDNSSEDGGEVPEELGRVSIDEEPRKEFLLASSGREGNIYIWRAGTDGRMQTFLCTPNKPNARKYGRASPDKIWIVLCWVAPNILLSSSKSAELIRWNLPKPRDTSKQYVIIHNDHNSLLFSIAAPIIRLDESNWSDKLVNGKERQLNAWTVGQDRLLLSTSLEKERKNLACYPTVGKVECFAESPLDCNRLAIGTGEGIIKLWDVSRPHIKNIIMSNFYQKIQGKVVSLAWHPHNEMVLAYGTSEGRVGYMDTNKKKTPTLLPSFFKSQIHKIEWGPMNGNIEDIGLFVVAEGKLVVFNTKTHKEEPQEVDTPDNTYVYTIAWKPNYELLLVSTKSGAIITYSTDLKILSTQYLEHKLQNIYWHSTAVSGAQMSKYSNYFAAVANFKELVVYNSAVITDISEDRVVLRYKSNGELINSIAWNPYSHSELVIARDDGVAQVWNVDSKTVVSTYINPNFEALLSVIWSPCDGDFVITASKDHTIKVWNKSEFPPRNEEEIAVLRKAAIKKISNETSSLLPKVEKIPEETAKAKKLNKNNLLPNFFTIRNTSQIMNDLRKLLRWKEGENRESLDDDNGGPSILDIFDSNEHMLKILELNEITLKQKGKYDLENTLSLFKGDISTSVKAAIDEKRVTPWVIMMAPMVSHKVWYAACEVYAQQLSVEPDSDPLEVAPLYLMCHKVEEAIKTLCEGALYREALTLAKCRLAPDDPTITDIIQQWGVHSLTVGNFEMAAQCNIVLGKYEDAASVLFRRSDVETLKFAVELAEKSGNEELHKAVLFRYNSFAEKKIVSENEIKLPAKVEAIILAEQTKEKHESLKLLETCDRDKAAESHKLQEVNGSEQTSVPTKAEAISEKDQADGTDENVGLLQKSDGDKAVESHDLKQQTKGRDEVVESRKLQEVNDSEQTSVPTKAEAIFQEDQAEGNDESVRLLQKAGEDGVESHELKPQIEERDYAEMMRDGLLAMLAAHDRYEVELQEANGNEQNSAPTKSEAILQKDQAEGNNENVRLLQKLDGDEGVESRELRQQTEGRDYEEMLRDGLLAMLAACGGDEVELQEANDDEQNSAPTKSEIILPKDQAEGSDEKVSSLQKSDEDEEAQSREVPEMNGGADSTAKKKLFSDEGSDENITLLEESDEEKEAKSCEVPEMNGGGDSMAKKKLFSDEGSDENIRLLEGCDGDEGAKSCEVPEMNGGGDSTANKKLFSDESSGRIEDSVSKEHLEEDVVPFEVNIGSLDSAAKPPEEKSGGSTTAVQKGNEGFLTTEEVRKLLSNSKLDFLNDSEVEPADLNKNSKDKCY